MRVGLNALYLVPDDCGGLETFARELIQALVALDAPVEYAIFVSLDAKDVFVPVPAKLKIVVCPFHARSRFVRYCWEQFVLPFQAVLHRLDLLHSLAYVGPVLSPVPTVLTVHDANTKAVGADMTRTRRTVLWLVSSLAATAADVVATVSQFSGEEICRRYGVAAERIRVILSGPGAAVPRPGPLPSSTVDKALCEGPYIAVIGGRYPHKNMQRMIEAFEKKMAEVPHNLLIAGYIEDAYLQGKDSDRIRRLGFISRSDLQTLMRGCDLFVMPSLYEGFGFPVLEAQALGAPVACSRIASLLELTRGSAATFDPENIDEMAEVIGECLSDREKNNVLRQSSCANVARFSWETAAAQYLRLYLDLSPMRSSWWSHGRSCLRRLLRPPCPRPNPES